MSLCFLKLGSRFLKLSCLALFSLFPFFSYLMFVGGFWFVLSGGLDCSEDSVSVGLLSAGFPVAGDFLVTGSRRNFQAACFSLIGWTPGGAACSVGLQLSLLLSGSLNFALLLLLSGYLFQGCCSSVWLPLLFFAGVLMYALVRVEGKFKFGVFWG